MERPNVVLELENVSSEGDYVEDPIPLHDSIVDAASLEYHDWNSLIQQCSRGLRSLKLLIRRDLLQHKSTYFRSLLGGDFRESSQDNVHMVWDMGTCCSLLQCMYCGKMEISSSNFQKVLEGAAFFGVDVAMSALLLQIHETTSNIEVLKCIPKFWSIAKGMGVQSLACACLDVFAVNFEDVVQEAGFEDLPSALLAACIDHRQLTVRSEKKLCEVVFNWLMYHQQSFQRDQSSEMLKAVYGVKHERSCERIFASLDSTTSSILGKIRVLLLPLEFLQGHLYWKYPANVFSVGASQVVGYDKLSLLIEEAGKKKPLDVLAEKGDELTIRITKHSLGSGLQRDFAVRVVHELPLLRSLGLDLCDSADTGFDTPPFKQRRSMNTLKLTRCKALQNHFTSSLHRCHKDTILVEWNDVQQRTTIVKERL